MVTSCYLCFSSLSNLYKSPVKHFIYVSEKHYINTFYLILQHVPYTFTQLF